MILLLLALELTCGAPPPLPDVTDLWAVEENGEWVSYVTAWAPAEFPMCWELGRAQLDYENDGDPDTPQVHEPTGGPDEVEYE